MFLNVTEQNKLTKEFRYKSWRLQELNNLLKNLRETSKIVLIFFALKEYGISLVFQFSNILLENGCYKKGIRHLVVNFINCNLLNRPIIKIGQHLTE